MKAGLIVDAVKIQDEIFGYYNIDRTSCNIQTTKCKRGQIYRHFDLSPGETVESIIYGRNGGTTDYSNLPCGFRFHTNLRTYGTFSWSNPCPGIYRVNIPPEKPLGIFFKENVKYRRMYGRDYFDGFTSEYNTETKK